MNRVLVCFSGGKTSGFMTKKILDKYTCEVKVVFANTGQENEETLDFVNDCDKNFNFNVIWIENKIVLEKRKPANYSVVSYNTATRNGTIFEDVIKKYGIPNTCYPHCTRELKERPIHAYLKDIGWVRGEYNTAIGIRIDESRRVRKTKDYQNIIYPLVEWGYDKDDINDFWEEQSFNLNLPEHKGNCKWCWKKSFKKHARLINESPEIYDFPRRMEKKYPHAGHNDGIRKRVFFRGNRSTDDLFKLSKETGHSNKDDGCSDSCEMYEMEERQLSIKFE